MELGYDEIVDSSVKVIQVARKIDEVLSDGLQPLPDLLALTSELTVISDIVADRKIFVEQLLDLKPEESRAAVAEIAEKAEIEEGTVYQVIVNGLALAAAWHEQINSTIDLVQSTRDFVRVNFSQAA